MRTLTWKALEYPHKHHSSDWFWGVGIITVGATILAIIFNNLLFAVFIIVSGIAVVLMALREPRMLTCTLNERGIKIDNDFYTYSTLVSFWVQVEYGAPKLLLQSSKKLAPMIIIPLEDVHEDDVRDFLIDYLPEEEMHEPLAHHIFDLLGY